MRTVSTGGNCEPTRSALFPLATAIPLFVLAGTQLILELFGGQETTSGPAVELEFSSDVDPAVARKRVAGILAWIGGFILLVFLLVCDMRHNVLGIQSPFLYPCKLDS